MNSAQVAVIGAGPAGLACAGELVLQGADVVVIDEQFRPGGQIYRQPPASFRVNAGADETQRVGSGLIDFVTGSEARWELGTTVWGIFPAATESVEAAVTMGEFLASPSTASAAADRFTLMLCREGRISTLEAENVLIAPGAYDLPVAFPGWTLPGVMAAGGIQAFLKSQRLLPGQKFCLAGAHPLQLIIAEQLLKAGARIVALTFAQSRPRVLENARHLPLLWRNYDKLQQARRAWTKIQAAQIPVLWNHVIVQATGPEELEAAIVASLGPDGQPLQATRRRFECDTLALGYGFQPSTELARQAGCECLWRAKAGGWVVRHDDLMQTTRPGIFAAGEITGIAGAEVAAAEGRLAAVGILSRLGRLGAPRSREMGLVLRRKLESQRRFSGLLETLFAPPLRELSHLMTDDTIVCRCEEVNAATLRQALRDHPHLGTANALKLFTRAGMGPCQGRFCGLSVCTLLSHERNLEMSSIKPFTARPPVKPIPLAALADYWQELSASAADVDLNRKTLDAQEPGTGKPE